MYASKGIATSKNKKSNKITPSGKTLGKEV
jgi:hypothetical protein